MENSQWIASVLFALNNLHARGCCLCSSLKQCCAIKLCGDASVLHMHWVLWEPLSHTWLLSIWNVANATEKLHFTKRDQRSFPLVLLSWRTLLDTTAQGVILPTPVWGLGIQIQWMDLGQGKIPWMEELGAGYYPWGRKESGTTERLHFHFTVGKGS